MIDDPKGLCKDVTNLGRWSNGDVEVALSSADKIGFGSDKNGYKDCGEHVTAKAQRRQR